MAKKFIGAVVVLALVGGFCYFIKLLTNNKVTIGYNKDYQPDQPLPFSHQLHAGTYKLDCKYCHTSVEVSRHASIPSLNICMNCHLQVKTDSPWIQKLQEAYNSGKSIAWNKVNMLPDHVKFNHAPHIKAGKDCTVCHGPVDTMTQVYQFQGLAMGWCVNCHRQPENNAPISCGTCHY
jgi:hypothetical protein